MATKKKAKRKTTTKKALLSKELETALKTAAEKRKVTVEQLIRHKMRNVL